MNRRTFLTTLAGGLIGGSFVAEAQQTRKVWRVGMLRSASPDGAPFFRAFDEGLERLGYTIGRDLLIEQRSSSGSPDQDAAAYAELARLNVDLLIVTADRTAVAAKQVAPNTPIVMVAAEDPVAAGLVESLAHPGGYVTGLLIVVSAEIYGKNLDLLKEALASGARIAVLFASGSRTNQSYLQATAAAAQKMGVEVVPVGVRGPDDLESAFATMKREKVSGLMVLGEPLFYVHQRRLNDLATQARLASMWPTRQGAGTGGLMAYGPDGADLFRRAAGYVNRILKGARPGDLPMEQPQKFEFVINLKTARALGLTIPPSLLARADQVIE